MTTETQALPAIDMYDLQIVDVVYQKDKLQFDKKTVKDEVYLVLDLLGTENPEQENEPYRARMFDLRDGSMVYTDKTGATKFSNVGKVLTSAGFKKEDLEGKKFKDLNWPALKGFYIRGPITIRENAEGKSFINVKAAGVLPLRNPKHLEFNMDHKAEFLGGAA